MNKRNIGLDLARIIACFMVIAIHVALSPYKAEGGVDYSRTLHQCLTADAVAVFWLITGFNLFVNYSYKKRLKSLLLKQVVPMLAFLVFSFLFSSVILDPNAVFTFEHSSDEYKAILDSIRSWTPPPVTGNPPLWYMYVYILLIVFSPALNAVVKWIDSDKKNEIWFAVSSVLILGLNDVSANTLMEFSHHSINALAVASIMVIWGHLLGKHKEYFMERNPNRCIIGGFLIYIGVNFVRSKIQFDDYCSGSGSHSIFWFTSYGLVCALGLTVAFCCLFRKMSDKSLPGKIVVFVASLTYPIYLIHNYVIAVCNTRFDLTNKIKSIAATCGADTIIEEIAYYFLEVSCIFIICLIISYIIRVLWRLISFYPIKRINKARS